MNHPDRIFDYLSDIALCIERASGYLKGVLDFATFEQAFRTQDAILRNIMVIGEAGAKLHNAAPAFTREHSDVPWSRIRAMRNLVIHDYAHVDLEVVWRTVIDDFPSLGRRISRLIAESRPADGQ